MDVEYDHAYFNTHPLNAKNQKAKLRDKQKTTLSITLFIIGDAFMTTLSITNSIN